ncbi:MAG TPA: hypothetical protein PLW83_09425 [Deltaproteobacteria bacterium]|nr:hypothetical protein [Deltaproteobacteria bacterium]
MREMVCACAGALLICLALTDVSARDFAIIKNGMFGTRKIELYGSLDEALANYDGNGKIYEITLKQVPLKRKENKKKVEVSEYVWVVDEAYLRETRDAKPTKKAENLKNPAEGKKP